MGRMFRAEDVACVRYRGEKVIKVPFKNCKQFQGWGPIESTLVGGMGGQGKMWKGK